VDGVSVVPVPGLDLGVDRQTHTCYITGWGRTCGSCSLPVALQETQIAVVSDDLCRERYPLAYNRTLHICLFDPVNQDVASCNGDSGGPLVCRLDASNQWELTGVTSWGTSGCPTTEPSVYARVSSYLSFICEETNNEAPGCNLL
jgi:elastase-2